MQDHQMREPLSMARPRSYREGNTPLASPSIARLFGQCGAAGVAVGLTKYENLHSKVLSYRHRRQTGLFSPMNAMPSERTQSMTTFEKRWTRTR